MEAFHNKPASPFLKNNKFSTAFNRLELLKFKSRKQNDRIRTQGQAIVTASHKFKEKSALKVS